MIALVGFHYFARLHIPINERMIDEERRTNPFALMTSLNMLVMTPDGSDFTAGECEQWLREAGFRGVSATRLADAHTLLVAFK